MRPFARTREAMLGLRGAGEWLARQVGALVLLGLLLAAFVRDLSQFPRSFGWPTVQGEVVESALVVEEDFSREFSYQYTVDGVSYESSRVTFFEYAVFANRYQNEQFIRKHRAGTPIRVIYDPHDPGSSVVMRMIPLGQMWSPVLLGLCLVSVLVSALVGALLRGFLRVLGRE